MIEGSRSKANNNCTRKQSGVEVKPIEIKITGEPKEIADLVLALQGQRWNGEIKVDIDPKVLVKATHDRLQADRETH